MNPWNATATFRSSRQSRCRVLSHAHIDQLRQLAQPLPAGFNGNIYCTFATRDLAAIMLEDSAEDPTRGRGFRFQKRAKHGLPPVEPLIPPPMPRRRSDNLSRSIMDVPCRF